MNYVIKQYKIYYSSENIKISVNTNPFDYSTQLVMYDLLTHP